MEYNTNLLYIQMPPLRRPKVPATSSSPRTLGTTRGLTNRNDAYELQRTKAAAKRRNDDVKKTSPSLRLKDIARLDLMSPYAVQKLTGNYRSSFPTVAGTQPGHVKMLKVNMPSDPSNALPRLTLTSASAAGNDGILTRSQSELSHNRPRDPYDHQPVRPHTESRLTRSMAHEAQDLPLPVLRSNVLEIGRQRVSGPSAEMAENNTKEDDETASENVKGSKVNGYEKAVTEISPSIKVMTRQRTGTLSRQRHGRHSPRNQCVVSASSVSRGTRTSTAEKMADLTMSEYTEVHATNRRIAGQVWGGTKPKTAPEHGTRSVRFNITNDVFEYCPW